MFPAGPLVRTGLTAENWVFGAAPTLFAAFLFFREMGADWMTPTLFFAGRSAVICTLGLTL